MRPLFNSLLYVVKREKETSKTPLEDFFTEMFAFLINSDRAILKEILKLFAITTIADQDRIHISTQPKFPQLAHHQSESRPDIGILIEQQPISQYLLVESKIGASEGDQQLQRYADHLNNPSRSITQNHLVYITRDYDHKNTELLNLQNVRFVQIRWYDVCDALRRFNNNPLVKETIRFMEVHDMSQSKQFVQTDIEAMMRFNATRLLMDETITQIQQDVQQRIGISNFGNDGHDPSRATEMRDNKRYIQSRSTQTGVFMLGVGYWMGPELENGPMVGIMIQSAQPARAKEVVKMMREFAGESTTWIYENEDRAYLYYRKPLSDFQDMDVAAIVKYLKEGITELVNIKNKYPQLPWSS